MIEKLFKEAWNNNVMIFINGTKLSLMTNDLDKTKLIELANKYKFYKIHDNKYEHNYKYKHTLRLYLMLHSVKYVTIEKYGFLKTYSYYVVTPKLKKEINILIDIYHNMLYNKQFYPRQAISFENKILNDILDSKNIQEYEKALFRAIKKCG